MKIGEVAQRAGVSVKAVRYYERLGLITPERSSNGYRVFDDRHLRILEELRELSSEGIPPSRARPFIDCLELGHEHGDDCVSSLAVYRDSIAELDSMIRSLVDRRDALTRRLDVGASRSFPQEHTMAHDAHLPDGLPVPEDDGAADHLPGMAMPSVTLAATDGEAVDLSRLGGGRSIIYIYPLTGRPGVDLPEGWDAIPGARGCSSEACDFRDHFEDLRAAGVDRVFGLSGQSLEYQREVVDRLRLPFSMLSDESFSLQASLDLPLFSAPGQVRLYARLTLVVRDGRIEHVFYPIFPPNTHAQQVLDWVRSCD